MYPWDQLYQWLGLVNVLLEPVLQYFFCCVVKDSFTFVVIIKIVNLESTFISSFDVKSLFTNVTLYEIIEAIAEQWHQIDKPVLRKESFIQLMKIATKEVEFSLNNIMFCQTDWIAMGSPLGPTLANILIGYIE